MGLYVGDKGVSERDVLISRRRGGGAVGGGYTSYTTSLKLAESKPMLKLFLIQLLNIAEIQLVNSTFV